MTDDLRPPYRIAFDNARDPYTARNALGIAGTGAGLITSVTAPLSVTGGDLAIDLSGYATAGNFPAGAWSTWSPTISASVGTFTSTTVNIARYIRAGKTVTAHLDVTIIDAGTAAGSFIFTLPVVASASGGGTIAGRDIGFGGYLVGGIIQPSDTIAGLVAYNGASLITTTSRPIVVAIYEGA